MDAEPVDEHIDEHTVPRVRPDVAAVDVDGELVLHDPGRDSARRLGPTATVVWHCLDGNSTLGEIADDVVAAQGGDRDVAVANLVRHVRRFARSGLLAGRPAHGGDPSEPAAPAPPTAPPGSPASRAPAAASAGGALTPVRADPCAHSNRFGWVGEFAIAAGPHLLGVRCNDAELLELLRRLFSPVLVESPDPEPNFSLRRAAAGRAHRLQEGCRTLVHTASLDRAVRGLRAFLAAYAGEEAAGRVRLAAVALVRDGAAVLVPERLRPRLGGAEDHLAERGLAIADAVPALSPDGTTVHVEPPGLEVDRDVLGEISRLGDGHTQPAAVAEPGCYRLAGWAWPARGDGSPLSAGELVAAAGRAVRNRHTVGAEAALTALAHAVTETALATLPVGPVPTATVLDAVDPLWLS